MDTLFVAQPTTVKHRRSVAAKLVIN